MSFNGMMGAGIFAMPAILFGTLGSFAPWMILIVGLMVAATVLVFARLASMFEQSGGPQLYAEAAFGPVIGFQAGWLQMISLIAARAANFHVLVAYLAALFPFLGGEIARPAAILALIAAMTWLNIAGMKKAVRGLAIGTALKLAPILILCLFAFAAEGVATEFTLPTFGAVEGTALLVYYAYSGSIANTYAAGETRDARRNVPFGLLAAIGAIIALYMLVQFAYNSVAPDASDAQTPLAAMGMELWGETGALVIIVAAIFSVAANQLTYYMSGPRMIYGMAERGLLPDYFAHVSQRYRTPDRAILFFSALVVVLALSGTFVLLADVNSLGAQFIALLSVGALITIRKRDESGKREKLAPYWWQVIALAVGFSIFAAMQAQAIVYLWLLIMLMLGTGLYFLARRGEIETPEPEFDR
jgi:amino acid transporter